MQTATQEVPPEVLDQLKRLYLVGRDKANPDRGYGLTPAEVIAGDTLNGYAAEIERLEQLQDKLVGMLREAVDMLKDIAVLAESEGAS